MTETDALKAAFRDPPKPSRKQNPSADDKAARRHARADRTRREALSPVRILSRVLLLPVVIGGLTVSLYLRTSPFEREDALRHLIAMSGCSAAEKLGVGRAERGQPGYHLRNDSNADGIACNEADSLTASFDASASDAQAPYTGGAKFIRP